MRSCMGSDIRSRSVRRKGAIVIIGVLFGLAAVPCAFSQGVLGVANHKILDKLNVDAPTQAKVTERYDRFLENSATARADLRIREAELSKLLLADKPDMDAVSAKLDQIATLDTALRMARIQLEIDLRDILGKDVWAAARQALRTIGTERQRARLDRFPTWKTKVRSR